MLIVKFAHDTAHSDMETFLQTEHELWRGLLALVTHVQFTELPSGRDRHFNARTLDLPLYWSTRAGHMVYGVRFGLVLDRAQRAATP